MQQGTHKGSVLDVPSGTELFPVLESTQKFTADGVAHSSIPALRSNDGMFPPPPPPSLPFLEYRHSSSAVSWRHRDASRTTTRFFADPLSHDIPIRNEAKRNRDIFSQPRKKELSFICGYIIHVFFVRGKIYLFPFKVLLTFY